MSHPDHGDRFFFGFVAFIILGIFTCVVIGLTKLLGWWVLLVPPGIVMVIAAIYGLGWGWELYGEYRHQQSHRVRS